MPCLPSEMVSFKLTLSRPECVVLQDARCLVSLDRDIPEEPELAPMSPEKRHGNARLKLDKLVYVYLQSGNGGILVDVSDQGLGLQAAAPLETAGPVRFRLSVGAIDQIEAAGELLWIDETGKRGGLRFTHLPDEVRDQVRIWLGQPRLASPFVPGTAPAVGVETLPNRKRDFVLPKDRFAHPGEKGFPPAVKNAPVSRATGAVFASPQPVSDPLGFSLGPTKQRPILTTPTGDVPTIAPPEQWPPARRAYARSRDTVSSRHGPSAITFFLALGVAIGILSVLYKGPAGESLIRLGERISGESLRKPVIPAPPLSSSSGAASPVGRAPANTAETQVPAEQAPPNARSDVASEPDANTAASQEHESRAPTVAEQQVKTGSQPALRDSGRGDSARVKSADPGHDVSGTEDNGEAELAFARRYLGGASGPRDTARAARLLWLAIEKGSTAAEVELAALYVRGEGVPKNCEQARILLTAASHENNVQAGQELLELRRYGCR